MKEKRTATRYFAADGTRPTSLIEVEENYFRECRLAGAAAVEVLTPAGTCEAVCGTRYLQAGTSIAAAIVDGRLRSPTRARSCARLRSESGIRSGRRPVLVPDRAGVEAPDLEPWVGTAMPDVSVHGEWFDIAAVFGRIFVGQVLLVVGVGLVLPGLAGNSYEVSEFGHGELAALDGLLVERVSHGSCRAPHRC